MKIKNFLNKFQFENKINFIFYLFKKKNFIISSLILYLLFFVKNKTLFEKVIIILLSVYLVYIYLNKKDDFINYLTDGKDNLIIKFIIKVKEHVFK